MKQISVSQNSTFLKAFKPNDEIYEVYNNNKNLKSKRKRNTRYYFSTESSLNGNFSNRIPTYYINLQTNLKKTINNTFNNFTSTETMPVVKKYFSQYQNYSHLNKHTFRQVNYLLIPGNSYKENYNMNTSTKNTEQQTTEEFNKNDEDSFDEDLYNKLMFFDNLSNIIQNDTIYTSAEYVVNKIKNKNIETPKCIIHNIFLSLVLKDIYRKIEIRNKNNELVSIDYVYNLLQNEIERIKGGIKNILNQINIKSKKKLYSNETKNKKKPVSIININKYLNTDFLTYLHFSKRKKTRKTSVNYNTSETKNTSDIYGNSEEEYDYYSQSRRNNLNEENKYKKIHIKSNDNDSDKGNYSGFIDEKSIKGSKININDNNKIPTKNKSGYILPNIIKKGVFVNNKNIDVIDSSTGKKIFNNDGSFNISFYDKKGNIIKNPDLNDKNIKYYDKEGKEIQIQKIPKINFYDKKGNIIENPNLDDSDIEYYDENGKKINTQTRIPIQLYDKKGNLIEEINNETEYYDINGNLIEKPKDGFDIYIPKNNEITIPEGQKILINDEGNQIIVPDNFNYVKNNDGKLILVDDKGNKINENEYLFDDFIKENEKKKKRKGKKKKYKKKKIKDENGEEIIIYETDIESEKSDESNNKESDYDESESEDDEIEGKKKRKKKKKKNKEKEKEDIEKDKDKKNKEKKKKKKKKKGNKENNESESYESESDESESDSNEFYESDFEEVEIEYEVEEKDSNGNIVKKKIKKKIKKLKEKVKREKEIEKQKKKEEKEKEKENENEKIESKNNRKSIKFKNDTSQNKTKRERRTSNISIDSNKSKKKKEKKINIQNLNESDSDNEIKSTKRKKINLQNSDNNENEYEDSIDSDDSYIPNFKIEKDKINKNEIEKEKYRKYLEIKKNREKELEEEYQRNQKTHLTHYSKKKNIEPDEEVIKMLLEEARKGKLKIDDNHKQITDEDIYKNYDKNSQLYLEWIKLQNKYIKEEEEKEKKERDRKRNLTHQFNYPKVGEEEFLIYKGKDYFEKKDNEKDNTIPIEFVNWIKTELKKIDNDKFSNKSLVKKVEPKKIIEEKKINKIIEIPEKEKKNKFIRRERKEIPKKKLKSKGLKSLNLIVESEKEEEMPVPISRSDSSDKEFDKTKTLKYLFEQIQKLKNLPPDEYTRKINSLVDFQLDNTDIMLNRKHADRINRFLHNLEYTRKSNINYQKILSSRLSYLPPIIIKKVEKGKDFKSYLDKFKAEDNIDYKRNEVKNIIEKIKY